MAHETKAMFQRSVDGAITSEELDRAFNLYLDRKYGPCTFYSETNVFRNVRDIRDRSLLNLSEAEATARRPSTART